MSDRSHASLLAENKRLKEQRDEAIEKIFDMVGLQRDGNVTIKPEYKTLCVNIPLWVEQNLLGALKDQLLLQEKGF